MCYATLPWDIRVFVVGMDIVMKLYVFKICRKFKIRVKMSVMLAKPNSAVDFNHVFRLFCMQNVLVLSVGIYNA